MRPSNTQNFKMVKVTIMESNANTNANANAADLWVERFCDIIFHPDSKMSPLLCSIRENEKVCQALKSGLGYSALLLNLIVEVIIILVLLFSDDVLVLIVSGLLVVSRYELAMLNQGSLAHALRRKMCDIDPEKLLCHALLPSTSLEKDPSLFQLLFIGKHLLILSGICIKISGLLGYAIFNKQNMVKLRSVILWIFQLILEEPYTDA